MKNTKAQLSAFDEIIVDSFAGGGWSDKWCQFHETT